MRDIPTAPSVKAFIFSRRLGRVEFELYPQLWRAPKTTTFYRGRKWSYVFFKASNKSRVPQESGIYMFVVAPRHANLRDHTYIFYVGQADDLQRRFCNYLTEMQGQRIDKDRERVVDFLNYFQGHVFFNYTLVPLTELDQAENFLVDHITPWANVRTHLRAQLGAPIPA
jgi:hypothetical protein